MAASVRFGAAQTAPSYSEGDCASMCAQIAPNDPQCLDTCLASNPSPSIPASRGWGVAAAVAGTFLALAIGGAFLARK